MQPEYQQQQSLPIRDLLTVFLKHKYKIIITFLLVLAVTGGILLYTPKSYVARAVVMVKPGREFVQVTEVGDLKPQFNQESVIRTEMQLITSRDLIARVVNVIGPEELYPKLASAPSSTRVEAAIATFRQNIGANPVKGSNLLEVYFRNERPEVAQQAVNALIDFLKEKHLQVFSDPKSSFLEGQLKDYQERLKKSEGELGSFKQRNEVFSLDEQRSLLIQERAQVESNLKTEQIRVKELQQKVAFLKDRKNIFSDATVTELRSKLNALEQKEQELTEKYVESSQTMINHRKEVRTVREQLRKYEQQAEEQARDGEMTKVQAELEPLQVKVAGLQKRYTEIDGKLRQLDGRTSQFGDLKRQAEVNEANYQTYLKKTEEARISEDLDKKKMTNITVIEQANLMPAKSNQKKVAGIGIFLSIALSLGLAFLSEYIPHRLTTPQSAEKKLGLPVLVTIPEKKQVTIG